MIKCVLNFLLRILITGTGIFKPEKKNDGER